MLYDSANHSAWLLREARELLAYRTLLRLLVINQFKQRYRRSLLGMGWMLVGPLLNTAVLSIAFNALFRSSIAQYPVYVMVGLIAWNFFAQTTTQGIDAAISGSGSARLSSLVWRLARRPVSPHPPSYRSVARALTPPGSRLRPTAAPPARPCAPAGAPAG